MLSTIVKLFIDPVIIFVLITAFGLWLYRKGNSGKRRMGVRLLGISAIWFYLISTPFLPDLLTWQLESQFLPLNFSDVENPAEQGSYDSPKLLRGADIVILGAGHTSDPRLPATSSLGVSSLSRLAEGVRLYRLIPDSRILFSGFTDEDGVSNAEMYAMAAMELGTDLANRNRYALLTDADDTWAESATYKRLVTEEEGRDAVFQKRVIVVTSALHMPRAIAGFEKRGFDPLASPAHYNIKLRADETCFSRYSLSDFLPSPDPASRLKSAIKEYAGRVELWFLRDKE